MKAATALDLFAGAGGASLGLIAAGWKVVAAVEWDMDAADTYRRNIGDHVIQADITTLSPDDLPDVDYVHFSAPCQGFSFAGKRDPNDPRNELWREAFRIVAAKRPRFITSENVRGQSTTGADRVIMRAFEAIGYTMTRMVLNAADYGVPQTRYRVILAGHLDGRQVPVPTPTHAQPPRHIMLGLQPWVTVRQALGIGGTMTHKFSPTPKSAGTPFYDGDAMPARAQASKAQFFVDFADRLDAPAASPSQPGRHGSLKRPEKEPGAFILDEPSRALLPGAHGQPGFSPRHVAGFVPDEILDQPSATIRGARGGHDVSGDRLEKLGIRRPMGFVPTERTDHGLIDIDAPSCTIKAGGNREADGHEGGQGPPSIPNIPLGVPAPTIQGGGADTGGAEPVRHRLREEDIDIDRPVLTIQCDARVSRPGHHGPADPRMGLRRLTVAECAILQDFPPEFAFVGSQTSQYRQVGNAFPRGFARAVAAVIRAAMEAAG